MAEGVEEQLRVLTSQAGDSAESIYSKWAGLTASDDDTLYRLVTRKLTANGKQAQIRESLEATLRAGGAVGDSTEEMLIRTGLTGFS